LPVFPRAKQPLVRFDATVASCTLKPRRQPVSLVDPKPRPSAPRLSFVALQHSKIQGPFFSPLSRRPEGVALPPRKPRPQGLATLSAVSAPESLGASFSPRRSWASPFEALLSHGDRKDLSIFPFRSCAFLRDLSGLGPALRRFRPAMGTVSLFATGWVRSGRDPCSLGLSGLSGTPSAGRTRQVSLPPDNPRDVGFPRPSRNGVASSSGPSRQAARHFPLRDAGLSGLSAAQLSRSFQTGHSPRTIFSSQGPPAPYETGHPSLCGQCRLS
jgi:hypothetical protein